VTKPDDFLDENTRAQDILLGSLGFSEEAKIISVQKLECGYKGVASWLDGETFEFESNDDPSDLELWALSILKGASLE